MLNVNKQKRLIKNYSVDDNKKIIIINYSDGTFKELDYSLADEKRILYLMKEQIMNYKSSYDSLVVNRNEKIKLEKMSLKLLSVSILLSLISIIGAITLNLYLLLILLFSVTCIVGLGNQYIDIINNLKEIDKEIDNYEKSIYLIEHNSSFTNEKVLDKENLLGVSNKTIDFINNSKNNLRVPIINLNNIDIFSQEDLEKINENVKVLSLKK